MLVVVAAAFPAAALAAVDPGGRDFENPDSADTSQKFSAGSNQRFDTPTDPGYDAAEPDDQDSQGLTNLYDERFDLFGFPSARSIGSAKYAPDDPHAGLPQVSGFNAAGAWKAERGRPDVTVAILDTGIRWNNGGLRTQVRLNEKELPLPIGAGGVTHPGDPLGGYDRNGNGRVDVDDYALDPRVGQAQPTGHDLITAFSDNTDADGNGYKDDIAGWDFFNDDNDPTDSSSHFAASGHGSGRTQEAVESGNDGSGELGVCPHCTFVPLRVWDTFVSDQNNFATAMIYAADNGVSVIEGADGGLYHSAYAERASQYAYDKGLVQTYSGNDLNTGNHNYPANYGHAMLIQGTVPDTVGLGMDPGPFAPIITGLCTVTQQNLCPGANVPPGTFFRGANTTQYGGKSSIAMEGATGSVNTGKSSGAAALVVAAGMDASPPLKLHPDETREILEQTAEDVTQGNADEGLGSGDFAQPGWDPHFGWGRVNLGAAVSMAKSRVIPPEAAISGPDWYAPLRGSAATITGLARNRLGAAGAFHWKLEWGPGQSPSDTQWTTVREADASGTVTDFGTIDLAAIRTALATFVPPVDPGGPVFSPTAPSPFTGEFTVRVTVTGAGVPAGVDRRVLNTVADPALRSGFPKRMGTGGEAPIRYADLNGDNLQELIVPTEDGTIHAYEPDGSELAGWPVHTGSQAVIAAHGGAPGVAAVTADAPGREPPRAPLIADLDDDGFPEVVTAAGTHFYVWNHDGSLRAPFPVSLDLNLCKGEDQTGDLHHRKCGFLASPAAGRLEGPDKPLDIVATALDGHLYALRGDGSALPGFPVDLVDPGEPDNAKMFAESIANPAIGDLDGDGIDDVVVSSNEAYDAVGPGPQDLSGFVAQGFADLLANAAGNSTRSYAVNGKDGKFLPGWPIKLNGGIQTILPLVGPGHDAALVQVDGEQGIVVSETGGSLALYDTSGQFVRAMQQAAFPTASNATDKSGQLNLFESASIGDVLGAGTPDVVKYGLSLTDAGNLLLVGQNAPYNHLIGAYDPSQAANGAPLLTWPTITDDFQFLSASTIAKVGTGPGPTNQVVAGTGLGLLHAYDGATAQDVAGFPKVTGGWLYAPAALSNDNRMAAITREGYLFEWDQASARCQTEWPTFRHDQQNSGNYDRDGTPPGAPYQTTIERLDAGTVRLSFRSPGDDALCGTPDAYVVRAGGAPIDVGASTFVAGTLVTRTFPVPIATEDITVQARDEAGNLGIPVTVQVPPVTPPPTDGGGGGGGGAGGGSTGGTSGGGTTTAPLLPTPLGGVPAAPACRDRIAPRSRIRRARGTRSRITLRGSSRDTGCRGAGGSEPGRVTRVTVSIARTLSRRVCRFLRADGTFSPPRSCLRTSYLPARGTAAWTFALKGSFPAGRYKLWVRGTDARRNTEHKARSRNFARLRVR